MDTARAPEPVRSVPMTTDVAATRSARDIDETVIAPLLVRDLSLFT